jgi:hypothetical protein
MRLQDPGNPALSSWLGNADFRASMDKVLHMDSADKEQQSLINQIGRDLAAAGISDSNDYNSFINGFSYKGRSGGAAWQEAWRTLGYPNGMVSGSRAMDAADQLILSLVPAEMGRMSTPDAEQYRTMAGKIKAAMNQLKAGRGPARAGVPII